VTEAWGIARRIGERAQSGPDRPALTVDGETLTYRQLWHAATMLAERLPAPAVSASSAPVTALMAHRHLSSYVAILACLVRGHTWVPINVEHPPERNLRVLRKSRAPRIVCGERAEQALSQILAAAGDGFECEVVQCADRADFETAQEVDPSVVPGSVPGEQRAYILFTSGSTGEPKGVPISQRALTGYLEAAAALMPAGPGDRFSQTFELTFDLSIHDLLLCWTAGAHLVVPTRAELTRPATYIRAHGLTRWFSVPSLAFQVRLQGDLSAGAFPSLRTSLFCGEALPSLLADEWALATPNGVVENWYGPTEATIACARFVVPTPTPGATPPHDLVPIGDAFPGMELSIHAEDGAPLADGTPGELLLSGRQLSEGYLDEPERNARAFVRLPGRDGVCYRTGDRAVRDPGGPVRFLGRVDNQVKVRGFRIELGEIEAVLRRCAGGVNALAFAWPPDEPSGRFVVAALETGGVDATSLLESAAKSLPDYMVPAQVVCLPTFPTNASGKADRREVARRLGSLLRDAAASADLSELAPPARRLMEAVLAVSPTLDPERVREAETVMAAGMDSLSFISLTAEIERIYGRTLGEDEVVRLSLVSFDAMVAHLEGEAGGSDRVESGPGQAAGTVARPTRKRGRLRTWLRSLLGAGAQHGGEGLSRRTHRSLQFITRFPQVLAQTRAPLVLAFGSSGTFRAIEPGVFEDEASRHGHVLDCYNVGLAAIGLPGLVRMSQWIAQSCEAARVRPAVVLYELDPAQLSVLPGRGDAELPEAFFRGKVQPHPDGRLAPEFEWSAAARGTWVIDTSTATKAKRRANWERARDMEIARTFAGDVEFVEPEVASWLGGLRALQRVAARTVVFVHPANRAMMAELPAGLAGPRFETLLHRVASLPGVELLRPDAFELADADFLDINHVNPGSGRPKLSRQLARAIFQPPPNAATRSNSQ
jgi:amino acid adenylation domain-containing protein